MLGAVARVRDNAGTLVIAASNTGDEAQGRIDLTVPYAGMEIDAGTYQFELEITLANGYRKSYESGTLIIVKDIAHDGLP